jgi:uncharacterized protein YraI
MLSIIIAFALITTYTTKMRQFWFKPILFLIFVSAILAWSGLTGANIDVLAQQATAVSSEVFITVTYEEQINVRNGPSTVLYDIIGFMQPGDTAPALGLSPGRDWVKIALPTVPGGEGWVYISLITLSPGNLRIIEPPPTATPLTTPTVDPTLAAAYVFEPTATRLPTFTPAPKVVVPQFTEVVVQDENAKFPMGYLVLGLGIPGLLGYLFSTIRRRF